MTGPVVRFLTDAWFDEINRSAAHVPADLELVLEQRVSAGPGGDVTYQVRVSGGRLTVGPPSGRPDLTVRLDYPTAVGLATGALSAHQAFLAGRIALSGNVTRLDRAGAAVAVLEPLMAAVAARTTYDEADGPS